ncbi:MULTISPECIES: hypothetical protein [unclassified Nocardiopsis]|uniref:hypothetical protein n=1 Tax=Nocardiopsis TaxID=2013 RepID=UPI00387AACF0
MSLTADAKSRVTLGKLGVKPGDRLEAREVPGGIFLARVDVTEEINPEAIEAIEAWSKHLESGGRGKRLSLDELFGSDG